MTPADSLSASANLISAAASLADVGQQPSTKEQQVSLSNLPPRFIELNGTLVNLRDVSLIRKANDKSYCFVIYLKTGTRCQTADYDYQADYIRDWNRVVSMLNIF